MRTPSRIFTSSSVTSHSYQDVSPDLEEPFVKVFVIPLQVSVMLSGFSANTFINFFQEFSKSGYIRDPANSHEWPLLLHGG